MRYITGSVFIFHWFLLFPSSSTLGWGESVKCSLLKFSLELQFCWLCKLGIFKCYCSLLIVRWIVFLSCEVPHAWLYFLSFTFVKVHLNNRVCKYSLGRREQYMNMRSSEKALVKYFSYCKETRDPILSGDEHPVHQWQSAPLDFEP